MKDYRREHPAFSLCGLNCALCPIHHMEKGCPGCGGGEGHQGCAIIRCSKEHGGVEHCYQCPEFPCGRYQEATAFDSFLSHQNMVADQERAKAMGLDAYLTELGAREEILRTLLRDFNDGRRKTLFCQAAGLLPLPELEAALAATKAQAKGTDGLKERAVIAVQALEGAAKVCGISLKLRRKPKEKKREQ